MKRTSFFAHGALLLSLAAAPAGLVAQTDAPVGDAAFQQAMKAYQSTPTPEQAEKVVRMVMVWPERPPVPEEARRHFIHGVELFKLAKSPDEMKVVSSELAAACHLAPWWPEARYNFALALEAMGDYPSALLNLKIYLLFKPSEQDAREAQDRIYAMEAKQQRAAATSKSVAPSVLAPSGARLASSVDSSGSNRGAQASSPVASAVNLPHRKIKFDYQMTTAPWIRELKGEVRDAAELWKALELLQPPPGAHGGYGLLGDDQLLGQPDGYGLEQLGRIARRLLKIEHIHMEQPQGWERIGVQSGQFTRVDQMNDRTLGWLFFDLRPNFEADLKKLAASGR